VNALSIARSLGRRGVPVDILADRSKHLPVASSRYCRRYLPFPTPLQESWLTWLMGEGARDPAVLLPGGDEGLELIARHRAELVACGHRPFEGVDDLTLTLLDKARTYELAAAVGTEAPTAALVSRASDIASAAVTVRFPAILKPQVSHLFLRSLPPEVKGVLVRAPDEVAAAVEPYLAAGTPMVLTELIPGPHDAFSSYYTYLDEAGEPLLHVTKRKLRQFPVGFGEGTFHEMAWVPEAASAGLRFFRAVGLRGLGNVEFKRDDRDGRLKLIECNLRFTQADALLRRSGIDLPALAYARLAGLPPEPPAMQRDGLRLWFPKNDARAFAAYRRTGATTTQAWIRSLLVRQMLPLWDAADPRPSTDELRRRAAAAPRRIGAVVRRSTPRSDAAPAGTP
jgi:predicted ATP-grasp superfamily ATP-dependent carboligase